MPGDENAKPGNDLVQQPNEAPSSGEPAPPGDSGAPSPAGANASGDAPRVIRTSSIRANQGQGGPTSSSDRESTHPAFEDEMDPDQFLGLEDIYGEEGRPHPSFDEMDPDQFLGLEDIYGEEGRPIQGSSPEELPWSLQSGGSDPGADLPNSPEGESNPPTLQKQDPTGTHTQSVLGYAENIPVLADDAVPDVPQGEPDPRRYGETLEDARKRLAEEANRPPPHEVRFGEDPAPPPPTATGQSVLGYAENVPVIDNAVPDVPQGEPDPRRYGETLEDARKRLAAEANRPPPHVINLEPGPGDSGVRPDPLNTSGPVNPDGMPWYSRRGSPPSDEYLKSIAEEIETYEPPRSYQAGEPDTTTLFFYPDGHYVLRYPDGTEVFRYPDGRQKVFQNNQKGGGSAKPVPPISRLELRNSEEFFAQAPAGLAPPVSTLQAAGPTPAKWTSRLAVIVPAAITITVPVLVIGFFVGIFDGGGGGTTGSTGPIVANGQPANAIVLVPNEVTEPSTLTPTPTHTPTLTPTPPPQAPVDQQPPAPTATETQPPAPTATETQPPPPTATATQPPPPALPTGGTAMFGFSDTLARYVGCSPQFVAGNPPVGTALTGSTTYTADVVSPTLATVTAPDGFSGELNLTTRMLTGSRTDANGQRREMMLTFNENYSAGTGTSRLTLPDGCAIEFTVNATSNGGSLVK